MATEQSPYHLGTVNDFTHLESEYSGIPPSLTEGYSRVEGEAGRAFVERFGQYLSDDQRKYFETSQMLFTDHDTARFFLSQWAEGINAVSLEDQNIGGNIYLGYAVGAPLEEQRQEWHDSRSAMPIHQSWAGRIVVHPIADEDVAPVGVEWLMDDKTLFERTKKLDLDAFEAASGLFDRSNPLAQVAVHEKVHGIQDWQLPLPILEAAAYYYEREIAQEQSWKLRLPPRSIENLANYYGACVEDLGEDVHRLVFGNLEPTRREMVLTSLKDRFNADALEKLSYVDAEKETFWRTMSADVVDDSDPHF